jgi:RecA-family ATPase
MSQKWDSFKKEDGIGIKQLIRLSKKYGFQGQINSFNNAEEDFNNGHADPVFPDIIDSDTGEILVKDIWEGRIIEPMTVLTSPNWVIDGFMADGLTLIAGAPGVGKTSAIVPLAMQVAGFYSHFSNISIKIRRKVIYLSEDTGQVQRIQYALQKRLKRIEADLPIEWPEIANWFKVVATKRSSASDIAKLAILAAKNVSQFPDITGQPVDINPLIVIDTASASFNVDSENDNAEIAKYISAIKEGLIGRGYPVWVVTHTPKALKRADVRDFSARGAGAWEGDANCVAYLFQEEGLDERFLKLGKHRYQSDFDEVAFESNLYAEFVTDQLRGAIEISVRWAIPSKSMESKRIEAKEMAKEEKFENLKNSRKTEILDAIQSEINAGRYPNKRSIRNLIKGRTEEIMAIIDDLMEAGSIMEIDLPDHLKVGGKKTQLVPNNREPVENPFK